MNCEYKGFLIKNDHPRGGYTVEKNGRKLVNKTTVWDPKTDAYYRTGDEFLQWFTSLEGAKKMIDYYEKENYDIEDMLATKNF